jgi:flagellar basal body-associated protein FliL
VLLNKKRRIEFMGKNNTKKNNGIGGGVAFIIIGVLLLLIAACIFIGDSDFIFNGADDINTMIEELRLNPGEYTSVRIDADFGAYAETQHTINGFIPAGKEQHYIVWLDDGSLISVTVKGDSKYDKMDAIEEQTYDYIDNGGSLGKSVTYVGKISTVSGDLKTYYQEALNYLGAADSDVNIYYLDIDTTQTKGSILGVVALFLAIGILLIVLGIVTIRNAKKQKAAAAQINSAAFSQNMAGNNGYTDNFAGYNTSFDNSFYNPADDKNQNN